MRTEAAGGPNRLHRFCNDREWREMSLLMTPGCKKVTTRTTSTCSLSGAGAGRQEQSTVLRAPCRRECTKPVLPWAGDSPWNGSPAAWSVIHSSSVMMGTGRRNPNGILTLPPGTWQEARKEVSAYWRKSLGFGHLIKHAAPKGPHPPCPWLHGAGGRREVCQKHLLWLGRTQPWTTDQVASCSSCHTDTDQESSERSRRGCCPHQEATCPPRNSESHHHPGGRKEAQPAVVM